GSPTKSAASIASSTTFPASRRQRSNGSDAPTLRRREEVAMAILDTQRCIALWRHLALAPGRTLGTLQRGRRDEYVVVTAAAALAFDIGRDYAESDVNLALERWLADPGAMLATDRVELRRALVDCHLLERDAYGRSYRRASVAPAPWRAALSALDDVDLSAEAQRARADDALVRAERKARWMQAAAG